MDIKSPEARSHNMSKIKCSSTKPEKFIGSLLFKNGFRYRVNFKGIVGKPDIYFTKKKIAVFVHGCFWHRHNKCKFAYIPKSNIEFWLNKFAANKERDEFVIKRIEETGVRILIVWECTVKKMMSSKSTCDEIEREIVKFISLSDKKYMEL